VSQGPHVRKPASGPRRPGRLETRISCEAPVRVRQKASLSSWGSTGWPMWTWEVSTATKRMSRVHCCKRPRGECDHIEDGTTGTYSPDRRHGGGELRRWHWQCTSDAAYRRSLPADRSEFATATASAAHDATRTRDKVRQPRVVAENRERRSTLTTTLYHP